MCVCLHSGREGGGGGQWENEKQDFGFVTPVSEDFCEFSISFGFCKRHRVHVMKIMKLILSCEIESSS